MNNITPICEPWQQTDAQAIADLIGKIAALEAAIARRAETAPLCEYTHLITLRRDYLNQLQTLQTPFTP